MSSYLGRHAELYDLFYADKPYQAEAVCIHERLGELGVSKGARLLDAACGTGRHALEFARLGYRVVGVDHSADMLAQARSRAAAGGADINFLRQDLRELDFKSESFDAITCLFDSLGYVQTNDGVHPALSCMRRALRPQGVLVLEFWHAAAMLRSYDPVRVRRWPTPDGQVLRISETTLDSARQLSSVRYSVYELRSSGAYTQFSETQTNRYFLLQEMAAHLTACGMTLRRAYSGYSLEEPITDETWHVVAFASREN